MPLRVRLSAFAAVAASRKTVSALNSRAFAALARRAAAAPGGLPRVAAAANLSKPASVRVATAPFASRALPLLARKAAGADATPTAKGTTAAASKARGTKKTPGAKSKTRAAGVTAAKARAVAKAKAVRAREAAKKAKTWAKTRALRALKRSFPKRHSHALGLFRRENSASGSSITEVNKAVLEKWKNLPQSAKQSYQNRAKENAENYPSEVERWLARLTPELKALTSSTAFRTTLFPYQARALRRIGRAPVKPRAYINFFKEVFAEVNAEIKRDQPSLVGRNAVVATAKRIGTMWKLLSDEQKTAYSSG